MPKLSKKYGDSEMLFTGMVSKMNKRFTVQQRKMLITDQAIYNMDETGFNINRRIPIKNLSGISVSTMKDGFFILRVEDE
jgi:myosin-1